MCDLATCHYGKEATEIIIFLAHVFREHCGDFPEVQSSEVPGHYSKNHFFFFVGASSSSSVPSLQLQLTYVQLQSTEDNITDDDPI